MTQEQTGKTVGQVARGAGVGVETIRFYERKGLIPEPPRRPSGYRQFPPETIGRLRFIQRAKDLGFTLKEIKELLDLRVDPYTTCPDIREKACVKLADVKDKIRALRRMERVLSVLSTACQNSDSISDCPILDALENGVAHE